jgi:methyltransferase (TIGR00027 family)
MNAAEPSRTAIRVALRRAAHQVFDAEPLVFPDPYALRILGPWARELERTPQQSRSSTRDRAWSRSLRAWVVVRSRFAEEQLARAVGRGVRQYVLLGAGLDTFALRNPWPQLDVWELDHPATQEAKQELLRAAGLHAPVHFVAAEFGRSSLERMLGSAGLRMDEPAFFAWLGVAPYLSHAAFRATVNFVAERPPGSALVLDYAQPRAVLPAEEQLARDSLAARVAGVGEPFQLFWTPEAMAEELSGFSAWEDLGAEELNVRYLSVAGEPRSDGLRILGVGPRLVCAWRGGAMRGASA